MAPDIEQLLETNDPPVPADLSALLALNSDINKKISEHELMISLLRAQKGKNKQIISAIRRIPNETILEICSHLPSTPFDSRALLPVSQVCERWRYAIVGKSALWSGIFFYSNERREWATTRPAVQFLKLCLDRAGTSLLSLTIHCGRGSAKPVWKMFDKMVPKSQWRQLSVIDYRPSNANGSKFEGADLVEAVERLPQSFTSLTKFSLANESDVGNSSSARPKLDLSGIARLRELTLDVSDPKIIETAVIPWNQLTDLTLKVQMSTPNYMSLLKNCVNLQRCVIRPVDPDEEYYIPYPRKSFRLSHLKSLTVLNCEWVHSANIQPLDLPSLEELKLNTDDINYNEGVPRLQEMNAFIKDCASTLQILHAPGAAVIRGLASLENIRELRLYPPFGTTAYDGRGERQGPDDWEKLEETLRSWTFPRLRNLEIKNHPILACPLGQLAKVRKITFDPDTKTSKIEGVRVPAVGRFSVPERRNVLRLLIDDE